MHCLDLQTCTIPNPACGVPDRDFDVAFLSQERMGRGYSREAYLALVEHARAVLPGVSISSDFISGFCGETETDHQDTLSLMEIVRYDQVGVYGVHRRMGRWNPKRGYFEVLLYTYVWGGGVTGQ